MLAVKVIAPYDVKVPGGLLPAGRGDQHRAKGEGLKRGALQGPLRSEDTIRLSAGALL